MIEIHPFGNFIPQNIQYLIIGSFPGKQSDWFYGSKRSQFWPILSEVYKVSLDTRQKKENLLNKLGIALTDIILSCKRKSNSNLDINLTNITLNHEIRYILQNNNVRKVFFSSRFVEKLFKKHFKDLILAYPERELITLPSPSPRYASVSKTQKVILYKEMLPA